MSSNFKLLITTDTSNEVWSYTIKLCESLTLYIKADILLVSFGGKPDKFQEDEAKALNLQVLYTDYFPDKSDPKLMEEAEKYLTTVVNDFDPGILHLNHYMTISDKVECGIL